MAWQIAVRFPDKPSKNCITHGRPSHNNSICLPVLGVVWKHVKTELTNGRKCYSVTVVDARMAFALLQLDHHHSTTKNNNIRKRLSCLFFFAHHLWRATSERREDNNDNDINNEHDGWTHSDSVHNMLTNTLTYTHIFSGTISTNTKPIW